LPLPFEPFPLPPPRAPPPFDVLVVLELGGFVAVLELEVLVEVELGVDVVLGVLVVLEVEEEVELDVLLELAQSRAASWLIVVAPCPRLRTSVVLTLAGRAATSLLNACAAVRALPQLPADTADETEFSWALRLLAWLESSSPFWPPQATTKATAKPRPPAKNAREPWPIRRLTLEAVTVEVTLGADLCPEPR
jgi:hypothetical protein